MHEHLELQFYSEKTADEAVLKFYPSTIKQKVLRCGGARASHRLEPAAALGVPLNWRQVLSKHHAPPALPRHLYLDVLRDCYLFAGCKARFLDQVLAVARMELFMPNVSAQGVRRHAAHAC